MPSRSDDHSTIRRGYFMPILFALALFVAIAAWDWRLQNSALKAARVWTPTAAAPDGKAVADETLEVLRAMKLVTVELRTPVRVECRDECWRGVALATVEAPARLLFGVDLATLSRANLSVGELGAVLVTIPKPILIGVDLDMSDPAENVQVSGLRFRSGAGEYQLGQARRRIYEEAHRVAFNDDTRRMVAAESLTRVEELLRGTLGEKRPIFVQYPLTLASAAP